MPSPLASWLSSWTIRLGAIAVIVLAITSFTGLRTAAAQKERPEHTSEDRAKDTVSLKQAFGNSQIDLYFQMEELETKKPGLTGVKFIDVVDVTGKELLHFESSGDAWLIDPDTVFIYKLHKSK